MTVRATGRGIQTAGAAESYSQDNRETERPGPRDRERERKRDRDRDREKKRRTLLKSVAPNDTVGECVMEEKGNSCPFFQKREILFGLACVRHQGPSGEPPQMCTAHSGAGWNSGKVSRKSELKPDLTFPLQPSLTVAVAEYLAHTHTGQRGGAGIRRPNNNADPQSIRFQ